MTCVFGEIKLLFKRQLLIASMRNMWNLSQRGGGGGGGEVGKAEPGVLTIYMENPEIPVGKSNGTHFSIWNTSEIMGYWSK